MQGFVPPSSPALGNPATQPVPTVPGPAMPGGVLPNLTQAPAAPMNGFPPSTQQQGTYPGYFRVPGPAALGPTPGGAAAPTGTGGVAGVSMAPISTVAPPAGPGGPHPLPPLPQVPLPQGFPNPFSVQAVGQAPASAAQAAPPPQPGVTSVTGPMGYMPGLGYFPPPGAEAGVAPASGAPGSAPPPTAFPVLPGTIQGLAPQAPPPGAPRAPGPAQQGPNPFWLQLAWQLVQTPAVRQVLGDSAQLLVESEDRMRALQMAASILAGPELQAAFKALTSGQMEQTRFTELFAHQLRQAFHAAGLLR
ncbi:MAG TPA: hypothetical protein VD902_13885 [Symbiobacteriaceae bacterium]|jgi:hypothetical protein|nr:hypothetical protein [Symbiobacteriaceae bacterium]